ncbi:hypothetical protein HPP92_022419 [Vanilla planifolia]|uniref:Agenet-like domain-containing protein n=1 Tax=Vanilla planifolia TaxID=51239 RepID=A0A835PTH4_VANPL|nr:hypothetical protein HPP92_022419 [Vanilla planifolia]
MGDPLPFKVSELVDTGSEGFWKAYHGASIKQSRPSSLLGEEHITLGIAREFASFGKQLDQQIQRKKDTQKATEDGRSSSLNENHEQYEESTQGNCPNTGHGSGHWISCLSIQKGSKVEVMSDDDGLKGAWFSAMVHDIKGNKAYVCFDDVSNNLGQLMEWIDLESDEQKAPRIRAVRSATSLKHEGTRKRSREQRGSYIWNVGDHVDAWIHDRRLHSSLMLTALYLKCNGPRVVGSNCFEKNLGDETMLTVHIPVRSDKKVVHSTYLRPSLIWKDGQWVEWSHPDGKPLHLHEGDTPQEKRQRLGRLEAVSHLEVDSGEVGKLSKDICADVSNKPEDARSLVLTDMDKTFCIGKSSREESTTGTVRTRSGLQKEGSRVVFGVPRPGKKRKFIEVSKHYVAGKSEKISEVKEPIKFAKYLMPQASRQFKSTSRVDRKGKKGTEVILKDAVTVENSQSFRSRTQLEKDSSLIGTSVRELRHVHPQTNAHGVSGNGNGNGVEKRNTPKFGPCSDHAEQTNVPLSETESCVEAEPSVPISKKKYAPISGTNLVAKTKSTVDRPSKDEDKSSENPGKVACSVIKQPRRSNRRIQPTSRLLEGLESSLPVSKIPSISHERKPHRGGSSSRGNAHG